MVDCRRFLRAVTGLGVAANFWYWMVLPMPPAHGSGLSHAWKWVGTAALLALVAVIIDRRPVVAAVCVALGLPIAFVPYTLLGMPIA